MCLRKKEMRHMVVANPNSKLDVFCFFFAAVRNDALKFVGSTFLAAFVVKLYCSVEVRGTDDLSSEGSKVKVYVVNSFVVRQISSQ